MLPEYFAVVGASMSSVGGLYYLYRTVQGTVQPNKISFFFWGAFPMIAFAAQYSQGVGLITAVTLVSGVVPFLIVGVASFNQKAYWRIRKVDYLFAGIGVLSMILWYVTKNPNVALTFALLADLAVGLPTVLKAYTNPETEAWQTYATNVVGFGLALSSIHMWTYENYAFVSYLFLMNLVIAVLAARKPVAVSIDAS